MNRLAIGYPGLAFILVGLLGAATLLFAWTRSAPEPSAPVPSLPVVHCVFETPPVAPVPPPPTAVPGFAGPTEPCPALDLDGDGVTERWEEVPDSCGTGGCVYKLYLWDRYVGEIAGHCPFRLEPHRNSPNGFPQDVIATWRLGAIESVDTRYVYKRGRYREWSESTCTRDACTAEHLVHR